MKRTVTKVLRLPPFRVELSTLEALISDLSERFKREDLRTRISVENDNEELEFQTFAEMREYGKFPPQLRNFDIHLFEISMRSNASCSIGTELDGRPRVRCVGPDEAWVAGVVEIARGFALRHRRWYTPIRWWALSVAVPILGFLPLVLSKLYHIEIFRSAAAALSYLLVLSIVAYMQVAYRRLFPGVTLVLRHKEPWIRKYSTELTLIAAAVSAATAIYNACAGGHVR